MNTDPAPLGLPSPAGVLASPEVDLPANPTDAPVLPANTVLPPVPSTVAWPAPGPTSLEVPGVVETLPLPAAVPVAVAAAPTHVAAPPLAGDAAAAQAAKSRGVARARWGNEEEEKLKKLVTSFGAKREWQAISEQLGTGRTASGVEQHWQVMTGQRQRNGTTIPKDQQNAELAKIGELGFKDGKGGAERRTSARWTPEEETILRDSVNELGKGKWTIVAERLNTGRSPSAVEQHWQIVTGQRKSKAAQMSDARAARESAAAAAATSTGTPLSALGAGGNIANGGGGAEGNGKGGGRWTGEEEASLRALIDELGPRGNWRAISDRLGSGRSPGAVEQHWQIMTGGRRPVGAGGGGDGENGSPAAARKRVRSGDPKSRSVAHRWTADEEDELRGLVDELGARGKWPQIAERLDSGRTPSGVEQHWKIMNGAHHGTKKQKAASPVPQPGGAPPAPVAVPNVAVVQPQHEAAVVAAAPLAPLPPPEVSLLGAAATPVAVPSILPDAMPEPVVVPATFEPVDHSALV